MQMEAIRKDDGLYYLHTQNNDVDKYRTNTAECGNNESKRSNQWILKNGIVKWDT